MLEVDLVDALDLMFDIEIEMPNALVGAGGNAYKARADAIVASVTMEYAALKKGLAEWRLRQLVSKTVPMFMVERFVDELIDSRRLVSVVEAKAPNRILKPGLEIER